MSTPGYRRARTPERKRERAAALLDGARTVAARDGVRSVTLVAIAAEAGLHHSAVRRYFRSGKHVLLELAADGWRRWADRIEGELGGRQVGVGELADVLVGTLVVDPLFCDLLGNVPLHLEHDLDVDDFRRFKRAAVAELGRIVTAIDAAVPRLGPAGASDLMTASNALAATLWQVTHPDATVARVYDEEPELGRHTGAFGPTLRRLIAATARGLIRPGAVDPGAVDPGAVDPGAVDTVADPSMGTQVPGGATTGTVAAPPIL